MTSPVRRPSASRCVPRMSTIRPWRMAAALSGCRHGERLAQGHVDDGDAAGANSTRRMSTARTPAPAGAPASGRARRCQRRIAAGHGASPTRAELFTSPPPATPSSDAAMALPPPAGQVTGMLENDPVAWDEIGEWIEAARVAYVMEHNRLGVMGNYYGGMLDIYSDLTQQCAYFGGHIEILEVEELAALRREVGEADLNRRVKEFKSSFDVQADCSSEELERAARTSVALDTLVESHQLGSLAYYHKGVGSPENEDAISSIILGTSLLTSRGVPVAGEYEIKNAQAMKIMDSFGAGGSFTEYYAVDYNDDVVLMGHDGPGHIAIAEGKTKIRPLEVYHGKVGRGLSVEMSVKHGPVTLLSVVQTVDGKLKLLVAEGESVPGPILEIGNTNSRYRFSIGARNFLNEWNVHGPAHHCAVGVGHISSKLKKLGALLGMECVRVC